MISRRNVREKVLFVLYSIMSEANDNELTTAQINGYKRELHKKYDESINNFLAALLLITRIAKYAEVNANNRALKYMPTEEDKNVSIKIAGNKALWELLENKTFEEAIEQRNINAMIPEEWIKKLFVKLVETERYKLYIAEESRDITTERKMLTHIWKSVVLKDENFQEILMDDWQGYEQDKSTVRTLVDFYFKDNQVTNFNEIISKEKLEFADNLLLSVLTKQEHLNSLIVPKLNNWDAERVALIDKILLLMGVSEFLYFPSIPKRVTINEYIEIAKDFSTDDSGRFVNGILDSIAKEIKDK